jgi:hypothetical protein
MIKVPKYKPPCNVKDKCKNIQIHIIIIVFKIFKCFPRLDEKIPRLDKKIPSLDANIPS